MFQYSDAWLLMVRAVFLSVHLKFCTTLRKAVCNFADDNVKRKEVYPMNPNGSAEGIAGFRSPVGPHLAMMPHPDRCYAMFEWPYISPGFQIMKGRFKDNDIEVKRKDGIILLRELSAEVKNFMDFKRNAVMRHRSSETHDESLKTQQSRAI
uniref:Uncharacterized protein n=1 Tax=Glossina palpalis gambiensis TaxID=67801 RepID=A0A1B0BLG0_9MUSC